MTTTTTLTLNRPVQGPEYDRSDPDTREPWAAFRRGGITATEVRDWGQASKRRAIIAEKVTGADRPLDNVKAVVHGRRREEAILNWAAERFGITPTGSVFARYGNLRHLASPDGVLRDPFTGELLVGPGSAIVEVKTGVHDLTPGRLSPERVLLELAAGSAFDQARYYLQIQWQLYVMNAERCLFIWEQRERGWDAAEGAFEVTREPGWCWIERDEAIIAELVRIADAALEQIDDQRFKAMPPVSSVIPPDEATLIADLFACREEVALAEAKRDAVWAKLQAIYLPEGAEDRRIEDPGFATVTVSTSTPVPRKSFDEESARAKAPALMAKYDALKARHVKVTTGDPTQRLTITQPR